MANEISRQCPALPFKSPDTAFILSFSIIMLNTDLHNPNMEDHKRMTLQQFLMNNRDIDAGGPLPEEYMRTLYVHGACMSWS